MLFRTDLVMQGHFQRFYPCPCIVVMDIKAIQGVGGQICDPKHLFGCILSIEILKLRGGRRSQRAAVKRFED